MTTKHFTVYEFKNVRQAAGLTPQQYTPEQFAERLKQFKTGSETAEEWKAMSKEQKADAKDVGGFVGAVLEDGKRANSAVTERTLLVLDVDHLKPGEEIELQIKTDLAGFASTIYSTRSDTPESPRRRIVVYLDEPCGPEDYPALVRGYAERIGLKPGDYDHVSETLAQAMFWPSCHKDADGFCRSYNLDRVLTAEDAAELIEEGRGIEDAPKQTAPGQKKKQVRHGGKADPRTLKGVKGAFCRVYSVIDVMAKILGSDYYTRDGVKWHYTPSNSPAGVVVYEIDDYPAFVWSAHDSDPASDRECNAFELLQAHYFGFGEENAFDDCKRYVLDNFNEVRDELTRMEAESFKARAKKDFEERDASSVDGEDLDWMKNLAKTKTGVAGTSGNVSAIIEHDPKLKDRIFLDEMTGRIKLIFPMPWNTQKTGEDFWGDYDDAGLICQVLEKPPYKMKAGPTAVVNGLRDCVQRKTVNRLKEQIESVAWDGVDRLKTLLPDYLGAEECDYTADAAKVLVCAMIGRVYNPGIKYDNLIVLNGRQGLGKSTFFQALAGSEFFTDSLSIEDATNIKESAQQTRGKWVIEFSELDGMTKTDQRKVKKVLSSQVDTIRPSYGRHSVDLKRNYVYVGTTNDSEYLQDFTGNRRFVPIRCGLNPILKSVWAENVNDPDRVTLAQERGQILAQGLAVYKSEGVRALLLSRESEAVRQAEAERAERTPDEVGEIVDFLLRDKIPLNWYRTQAKERRYSLSNTVDRDRYPTHRDRICAREFLNECKFRESPTRGETIAVNQALKYIKGLESARLDFGPGYGQQRGYKVTPEFWETYGKPGEVVEFISPAEADAAEKARKEREEAARKEADEYRQAMVDDMLKADPGLLKELERAFPPEDRFNSILQDIEEMGATEENRAALKRFFEQTA